MSIPWHKYALEGVRYIVILSNMWAAGVLLSAVTPGFRNSNYENLAFMTRGQFAAMRRKASKLSFNTS